MNAECLEDMSTREYTTRQAAHTVLERAVLPDMIVQQLEVGIFVSSATLTGHSNATDELPVLGIGKELLYPRIAPERIIQSIDRHKIIGIPFKGCTDQCHLYLYLVETARGDAHTLCKEMDVLTFHQALKMLQVTMPVHMDIIVSAYRKTCRDHEDAVRLSGRISKMPVS